MDKLIKNLDEWIGYKVDAIVSNNQKLAFFAPRIKKGLHNLIVQNKSMIEQIMPFITDEEGNVDIGNMRNEILSIWNDMPQGKYQMGAFTIETDKGWIKLHIPETALYNILLGDLKSVKFGTNDVEDFIDLFKVGGV